ncbi:hypothetical protein [uncultured Desulfobacter sp.]|uniref:hypothetical protein n=1 Tax=uncultured Desulfobacter sp. TaxID=240139 RepID=UPI002AA65917|nr:hypothetical protein [uncultured Desulfobacter sp.]
MSKRLVSSIFLIACIFSSFAFAADKEKEKITDLTPWKGNNASMAKFYDSEDGERYFEKVAEHAPKGYTKKIVKDHILGRYAPEFTFLNIVDENTVIIDDQFTGDYVHVGSVTTHAHIDNGSKNVFKFDVTWQIFKTDSEEMIKAGYKYLLFIPFHGQGKDSLRHFHLRYGNENFDFLATDPSLELWWPTLYQPAETDEAKIIAKKNKDAKSRGENLPPLKEAINE